MHPAAKSKEEWLQKAQMQELAFGGIISRSVQLEAGLSAEEWAFLQSNLIAHAYFMKGMSRRLEYIAKAWLALDKDNTNDCSKNLELAKECFSDFRIAKILCSQGKWSDWYRGDKKMNLERGETDLNTIIQLIKEKN